jgi:hypothetical protein
MDDLLGLELTGHCSAPIFITYQSQPRTSMAHARAIRGLGAARRCHRARPLEIVDSELVARVTTEGVVGHQLINHLLRQGRLHTPGDVDAGELRALGGALRSQFVTMTVVTSLRMHGRGPRSLLESIVNMPAD